MKRFLAVFFMLLLVFGCGGSGGGDAVAPTQPPPVEQFKVVAVSPEDGASDVALNSVISARLSADPDLDSYKLMSFQVYQGSANVPGTTIIAGRSVTFTPFVALKADTTSVVYLSGLKDKSGTALTAKQWSFTTGKVKDVTPPKVLSVTPTNGAIVASEQAITVLFNEPIDPATAAARILNTDSGIELANDLFLEGNKLAILPRVELAYGSNYRISVKASDVAGNPMPEAYVWIFSTIKEPDEKPPRVEAVTPSNGSTVDVNTVISVTMSEEIDKNTIVGSLKVVNTGNNSKVDGTVKLDAAGKKLNFTRTFDLAYGTTYQASLQGLKDLTGNLMEPYSWTFSTVKNYSHTVNLPVISGVFWSAGGADQAVFDRATGTVVVKKVGAASTDVSLRWANFLVEKDRPYLVSFTCASTPANLLIEVQLKKNSGDYHPYATASAPCNGTVSVELVPDGSDTVGRVNINFGAATGTYVIGPVEVKY